MGNRSRNKKPRIDQTPIGRKIRKEFKPESFDQMKPSWRLGWLDKDGRWGWDSISKADLWDHIHRKLVQFETMTWAEIKKNKKNNHSILVKDLVQEAQDYLLNQKLDDYDKVFSLRLSSKKRIFGIRKKAIFNVLWYDLDHAICPAHLRHT